MGRQVVVVLYVVAMAAIIVGLDFVFFRDQFWKRLTVNIGMSVRSFLLEIPQASMNSTHLGSCRLNENGQKGILRQRNAAA